MIDSELPKNTNMTNTRPKQAIVLIQTGSPDNADTKSVRRYLREFLSDPRILSIPWLIRMALLYGIILPKRSPKSAKLYQSIWLGNQSPLMANTRKLGHKLQQKLSGQATVSIAMRYGNPSLAQVIDQLLAAGHDEILFTPLFPQYASATTGSIMEHIFRLLAKKKAIPNVCFSKPFYNHPLFISSYANLISNFLQQNSPSFKAPIDQYLFLFAFHGLPESQIQQTDTGQKHCQLDDHCCQDFMDHNPFCYRAQCRQTATLLASKLHIARDKWQIIFQSRFGKGEWLKPYLEESLPQLIAQNHKHLLVIPASFLCDSLETLEELHIRGQKDFLKLGGEDFQVVPCLNDQPEWVESLAAIILHQEKGLDDPRN